MDVDTNIPQVQLGDGSGEDVHTGSIEHPALTTRPLILTSERVVEELLVRYSQLPWSREHLNLFRHYLFAANSWFVEVVGEAPVGLVYLTNITPTFCANLNVVFWDRKFGKARREVVRAVLKRAFDEFELTRIQSWIPVTNPTLQIEFRKCGMRAEGLARGAWRDENGDCDAVLYGMLRSECD